MTDQNSEQYPYVRQVIEFDFDQYRKLLLAKAVCMNHSIIDICFLEGIYEKFLPFLNVVLIPPRKDTVDPITIHKTKSRYPFKKEMMVKWDQRFPSVSTYMTSPCRGYKMIDIDINDETYASKEQLDFFTEFVKILNVMNSENSTIKREDLKKCYGYIQAIGDKIYDILSTQLEIREDEIFYTGRGFQVWTEFIDEKIAALMRKGYVCSSNVRDKKAQRLFSPIFMRINEENKGHMQCCVPYKDWNRFKFSNPAYFNLTDKKLRELAMEYNEALMVSRMRSGGEDHLRWYDDMSTRQVELEKQIYRMLKVNIKPIIDA